MNGGVNESVFGGWGGYHDRHIFGCSAAECLGESSGWVGWEKGEGQGKREGGEGKVGVVGGREGALQGDVGPY